MTDSIHIQKIDQICTVYVEFTEFTGVHGSVWGGHEPGVGGFGGVEEVDSLGNKGCFLLCPAVGASKSAP